MRPGKILKLKERKLRIHINAWFGLIQFGIIIDLQQWWIRFDFLFWSITVGWITKLPNRWIPRREMLDIEPIMLPSFDPDKLRKEFESIQEQRAREFGIPNIEELRKKRNG